LSWRALLRFVAEFTSGIFVMGNHALIDNLRDMRFSPGRPVRTLMWLALLVAGTLSSFGELAAINYNYSTLHNQYLCVDSLTGTIAVLNTFDFDTGFWTGVLISDAASNEAYALSSGKTLYTFDLNSGAVKRSVPTGMDLIAPAFGGQLVGIKNVSSGSFEFHSVDPVTGTTTMLSSFTLSSGYYSDSFITDLVSGVGGSQGTAYFLESPNILHLFNVTTGAALGTTVLSGNIIGLATSPNGMLISIQFNGGQWGVYSINPVSGNTVLLNTFNPSSGIAAGLCKSDLAANRLYEAAGTTLYTFDLSNGSILSSSNLTMTLQSLTPGLTGPCPVVRMLNASTRAVVGTGNAVLIGGFIINGTVPMQIIVRGLGPSLAGAQFPNPLQDPVLELYDASANLLRVNDNWQDSPADAASIQGAGLAPANNSESALIQTLNPGSYTAVLRGQNNTTGTALVEIYDAAQPVGSELVNIGTRGSVGTQNDVMIGGFILGGTGVTNVIVRALGPSLSQFGITNALADPTLEVFNGQGASIGFNDSWGNDPNASVVTAKGLAPSDPLEAALALMPSPGAYTAIVAGQSGGTGLGLVEVYHTH
jgi:hypothetical protein